MSNSSPAAPAIEGEETAPNGLTLAENYALLGKFADANDELLITIAQLRSDLQAARDERDARVDTGAFFEECLAHRTALNRAEAAESTASQLSARVRELECEKDNLLTIAKIIRYWLAWDEDQRRVSDPPPHPDNHIVIPPTWPSRRQFENWAAVLERAAPSSSETGDRT